MLFRSAILETFEAGLQLLGHEVKSARLGGAKLSGAYVTVHNGELNLINARISPYAPAARQTENYDPLRSRRLLLHKKEIARLSGQMSENGLTVVPLSLYTKGRHLKLEIALAKGKKQYDKRRAIKDREWKREKRGMTGLARWTR